MRTPLGIATIFLLLVWLMIEGYQSCLPFPAERTAMVMGTTVRVKVNGSGAPHWTNRALFEIRRLEKVFNKFDSESEISLINKLGGRAPLQVSTDTFDVLTLAQAVNRASGGAFDVTLGDPQGLILNEKNRTVRFIHSSFVIRHSSLDLGGIGKGYAVESARQLLLKKGVKSAIIDAHSSIAVIGDGWRVGIRDPRYPVSGTRELIGVVALNDGDALSTSGQYEQPGHIVDPRSGRPADRCLSVTVVAKDAALADALSTAVFVLGPVDGLKLLQKFRAKSFIIDRNGTINDNLGVKLR